MKRIALFASGSGTNLENIAKECHNGRIPAEASLVICDKPEAGAIKRARNYGIPVVMVDRKQFATKEAFEAEISKALEARKIDLIVLAGFMRILSPSFVRLYKGKIINIHPSLLPAFPGAHGIKDAFDAKVKETGVTVHFVDEGVDTGPVILQKKVTVEPTDTLEQLEEKIHSVEYQIYPEALRLVVSGKVKA